MQGDRKKGSGVVVVQSSNLSSRNAAPVSLPHRGMPPSTQTPPRELRGVSTLRIRTKAVCLWQFCCCSTHPVVDIGKYRSLLWSITITVTFSLFCRVRLPLFAQRYKQHFPNFFPLTIQIHKQCKQLGTIRSGPVKSALLCTSLVQHAPFSPGSGGAGPTNYGIDCLDVYLHTASGVPAQYDLVTFNFGLHDLGRYIGFQICLCLCIGPGFGIAVGIA